MAWLVHSAKGTTWSKHKYIKKVGNRYYYKDDLQTRKQISNETRYLNEAVARVQNKAENAPEGPAMYGNDVYFNKDHRNNYRLHKDNIERKLATGAWDKYASSDKDVEEAVIRKHNLDLLKKQQKLNEEERSTKAKAEMWIATTDLKAREAGKKFVNKLFKKKK